MRESHLRLGLLPLCSRVCVRQNSFECLQKSLDIFRYYWTPMKNPSTLRIQDKDVTYEIENKVGRYTMAISFQSLFFFYQSGH